MLPAGLASASTSPLPHSRAGRLRFSFRPSHHHHHPSPGSPVSPALTTATASTHLGAATLSSPPPGSTAPQPPAQGASLAARARRTTSPLNNTESNSWIPTISGVSGLSRVTAAQPATELSTPSVHATTVSSPLFELTQANTAKANPPGPSQSIEQAISQPPAPATTAAAAAAAATTATPTMVHTGLSPPTLRSPSSLRPSLAADHPQPSIRFTPHMDTRSSRESLHFNPIERVLRNRDERIRVGRFSDRDANNPSAPVGFRSKVVSRRHCEFWCEGGQWYVKDVKSSSGTFLNHIRLSAPGMESKAYQLNDGDILQLGIDFKGGEEQIFRCVKIRVELNRAWQKLLNNFNVSTHKRLLQNLSKGSDTTSQNSSECSICLFAVAPCQSLFVAPCSHTWHYKCIRPLIEKKYPTFLCPNCRAVADLDRDIEDDDLGGEWQQVLEESENAANNHDAQSVGTAAPATAAGRAGVGVGEATTATTVVTAADAEIAGPSRPVASPSPPPPPPPPSLPPPPPPSNELRDMPESTTAATGSEPHVPISNHSVESPIPIPSSATTPPRRNGSWRRQDLDISVGETADAEGDTGSSSGGEQGHEGPMTPMNDAGPFVLDGGHSNDRDQRETLFLPLRAGGPGP